MEVLKMSQICGYLPYGLFIAFRDRKDIEEVHCWKSKKYVKWDDDVDHESILSSLGIYEYLKDSIPVLRPLSDLYEIIVHNGKEIVPIVELAKMGNTLYPGEDEWVLSESIDVYGNTFSVVRNDDLLAVFYFHSRSGTFRLETNSVSIITEQLLLLDFLNELKIDYRGLIDAGLAVSVYDVENPYK